MRDRTVFSLVFLVLALPLGLRLVFLMPLGQVPDEPQHVLKADALLGGEWIGHRHGERAFDGTVQQVEGVDADRALLVAITVPIRPLDPTPTQVDPNALVGARAVRFGSPEFSELGSVAGYFPGFYLPAALAIALAKASGHGARVAFLSARLANLAVALGLGAACLRVARRARPWLLGVLLTPQTISLMASASEDGLLIASAALAAALVTSLGEAADPTRRPAFALAAVLVALICLAKPPYLPMTCLLLLPLRTASSRPGSYRGRRRLGAIAVVCAVTVAWTWAAVHVAATPRYLGRTAAGPLWPGHGPATFTGTDAGAQLRVLLHPPTRLVSLPLRTIVVHPEVFAELVDRLAWLNLFLPTPFVLLWGYALVQAWVGALVEHAHRFRSLVQVFEGVIAGVAALLTVLLIYLSLYLGFTPVGFDWVSGVQGRYLIPVLPLLGVAVTTTGVVPRRSSWLLAAPIVVAALAGEWIIPHTVWHFYHSRGL